MRPSSLRVQRLVHVCNSTWSRALLPSVCLAERPACPSRAASSSAATVQKKRRQLPAVAAERGWLQEEEAVSPPEGSMQPRFDWTMRRYSKQSQAWSQFDSRTSERPPKRYKPNAVTVRRTDRFYGAIDAYRKRFKPLVQCEQAKEEEETMERLREWSLTRLQEEGYSLPGVRGFWLKETQFGKPVACFSFGPGRPLGWNRFESATQAILSKGDPLSDDVLRGSVVSKTLTQVQIAFEQKFELSFDTWRLDLRSSNIAYQRMLNAIEHLNHDPGALEEESTPTRQMILQGTMLRDLLLKGFQPSKRGPLVGAEGAFAENQLIQSWARRYQQENPVVMEGDPKLNLNRPQIRAIATMLGERLSLIQGPPGTGKTRTIIEAVRLLKEHFQIPYPILVCTYTNVAVDNLVEGFASTGAVSPLRVGFAGKVKPSLQSHTLDAKIAKHPIKKEVDALGKEVTSIQARLKVARRRSDDAVKLNLSAADEKKLAERISRMERDVNFRRMKIYGKERAMLYDIVTKADVICTTCITSACAALQVIDFPVVFLDEASMSTEPASLIPIMKGSQHVALIGDHKQLPPVITSSEAKSGGLAVSLFERLTREGNTPSVMLDLQYRMHPALSHFPASEFYNLALKDGTVNQETGCVSASLLPPKSLHLRPNTETGGCPSLVFLDHDGLEAQKDRSRVNYTEAAIVCNIVEDLLLNNPTVKGEDIGVISPYIAQIALIDRLLKTDPLNHDRFVSSLGRLRALETASIEVKTVDGFEGREKDIIVFTTVRSNPFGRIGFLADRRRMNVGLTRAKRGLFLVGNARTLRRGKVEVLGGGFSVPEQDGKFDMGHDGEDASFDFAAELGSQVASSPDAAFSTVAKPLVGSSHVSPTSSLSRSTDLELGLELSPLPSMTFDTNGLVEGNTEEQLERAEGARVWRRYLQWLDAQKLVLPLNARQIGAVVGSAPAGPVASSTIPGTIIPMKGQHGMRLRA